MALTPQEEEELARLEGKFGVIASDMAAEEAATVEAKYGLNTAEAAPQAAPQPQPERAPPSIGAQVRHAAGGIPQAAADFMDMPYYMRQIGETVSEYIPQGVKDVAGTFQKYHPVFRASSEINKLQDKYLPGELTGKKPITDLPGLKQAKELLTKETVTREEAPAADAVRTALEWGSGGLVNAARRGAAAAIPDVVSALGASGGQLAEDALVKMGVMDEGGAGGEIIGGLTGLVAGRPRPKIAKPDAKATEFILKNASDPDTALKNLEEALARGEKGTLADLTQDPRLFDIERGAGTGSPEFAREAQELATERQGQIIEDLRAPLGTETAEAARETATQRVAGRTEQIRQARNTVQDAAEAQTEAQIAAGRNQASQVAAATDEVALQAQAAADASQAADTVIDTGKRPAQTSRALAEDYASSEKTFNEDVVRPAWDAFDEAPPQNVVPMLQSGSDYYKGLKAYDRQILDKEFGDVTSEAKIWLKKQQGGQAAPEEISAYLSRLKEAVENSKVDGRITNPGRLLGGYIDALEQGMAEGSDLYAAAREASQQKFQRYSPERLGKARRAAAPERFAGSMGLADEAGAETIRLVQEAQDPALVAGVVDHLKAVAKRDGGVDNDFIVKYSDVLNELPPGQRQQFLDAAEARIASEGADTALEQAAKAAESADKAATKQEAALQKSLAQQQKEAGRRAERLTGATSKGIVGEYAKAPEKTIRRLMSSPDNTAELKRLYRYMESTGNAESFKAALRQRLDETLTNVTTSQPDARLRETAIKDFPRIRDQLLEVGAITPEQAADMSTAFNRTRTIAQRRQALTEQMTRQGSEYDNLLASGLAALTLTAMPGTQTLLVGGAVRRFIRNRLLKDAKPHEVAALERLLLDPGKFLDAAKNAKTAEEAAQAIVTKAVAASQTAAALAPEEEE